MIDARKTMDPLSAVLQLHFLLCGGSTQLCCVDGFDLLLMCLSVACALQTL